MSTASFTDVRDNLSEVLDRVAETGEALMVTRHGRRAAVILSVDEYESLVETLNVLSDPETLDAIEEADQDLADGNVEEDA